MSISSTFALATGLAARTGPTHAAAHQVCNQVWLASSLMADSLAVAAQALLARTLAAGDKQTGKVGNTDGRGRAGCAQGRVAGLLLHYLTETEEGVTAGSAHIPWRSFACCGAPSRLPSQPAQVVVERTMQLALGLGLSLALVLGVTSGQWQRLFTQDPAVLQAMALIAPAVVSGRDRAAGGASWQGRGLPPERPSQPQHGAMLAVCGGLPAVPLAICPILSHGWLIACAVRLPASEHPGFHHRWHTIRVNT